MDHNLQNSPQELKGEIDKIIYYDEAKDGFSILSVKINSDKISVIGNSLSPQVGYKVRCFGKWAYDQKYGRQFKATHIDFDLPTSEIGIVKYLSELLPGIGLISARKIYDRFGEKTLDLLTADINLLKDVHNLNLSESRLVEIKDKLSNIAGDSKKSELMTFLLKNTIGYITANKIYNYFIKKCRTADFALSKIKQDPYLIEEVIGVGFKTADRFAISTGIGYTSLQRIKAYIRYKLQEEINSGNCYIPYFQLHKSVEKELGLENSAQVFKEGLNELVEAERIINHGGYFTTPDIFESEKFIAKKLSTMIDSESKGSYVVNKEQGDLILTEEQKTAIETALSSSVTIITGGPGTGKTTITRILLDELKDIGVGLCAPTGKAAKRLKESTGREAYTIHRLLTFMAIKDHNVLPYETLIVDEMSMVDVKLFAILLDAIKLGTRLILIGDVDQLPSVGPGLILKDLIESKRIKVCRLTNIKRQGEGSHIVQLSHSINHGKLPPMTLFQNSSEIFFHETDEHEKISEFCLQKVFVELPNKYGWTLQQTLQNVQILIPGKRSKVGVLAVNELFKKRHDQDKNVLLGGYSDGNKVMQCRNNYELAAFNGDIGTVKEEDSDLKRLSVEFEGEGYKQVCYDEDFVKELQLAYACTVHKTQGCEFHTVILVLHNSLGILLLNRGVLYTAVTRAQKNLYIVGERSAFEKSIFTDSKIYRTTFLKERLANKVNI